MTTTKICTKCATEKPLSEFHFKKDTQKYSTYCRSCTSEYNKSYREKKKEQLKEYIKNYYNKNKATLNAKMRVRYIEKKDEYIQYRAKNKEEIAKYNKEYKVKNADKIKEYKRKNRALFKNYKQRRRCNIKNGKISAKEMREFVKNIKNCYWCNGKLTEEFHLDHYVPLSKGGEHILSNLVLSCPACNLSKGAKDPYEFALSKGRLL